ncbi:hypothetical protein HYH02_006216 [Chlamydomonas schloesseri]|uniref:Ubiquitin thioesterase n=1 Tax=Chlamydomonas schloesseri TaxID=2026947 RepID=A0A836B692_9CHLO|nr:hypothetical protein HYH02_006216 [Chlamydomonas schloesseri]|eukprot:KAG2448866.1 hypothetical protein HYH02_006216 [Chlamydomonas schloesseri]
MASTEPAAEPGAGGSEAPDRPSDEAILQQQNQIRAEQAKVSEYVGQEENLDALKAEYENGNQNFVQKISKLGERYRTFRRTRGDGNCFFRGFIYAYLEGLLQSQDLVEANRFMSVVQSWKGKLVEGGFQELVFEDAMELLLEQVKEVTRASTDQFSQEKLLVNMRDDTVSNMIVMFLRLVTSCEVQRREDFFFPFILGMYDEPPATVELFCQRHVEPMGEESDHLHIVAVTEALQIPVRVVYLDSSGLPSGGGDGSGGGGGLEASCHGFVPDSCPPGTVPRVHLLYRPGHYDILYAKST